MHEFTVRFRSLRDIQDFVELSSRQSVAITLGNDRFQIHATSFMGIFALNCKKPQTVRVECTDAEFAQILEVYHRFLDI